MTTNFTRTINVLKNIAREFNEPEFNSLIEWIGDNPNRLTIIDTVVCTQCRVDTRFGILFLERLMSEAANEHTRQ